MTHYQRSRRYMGYNIVFEEFGGMWQARVETPEGKIHRTGYALEYEYAVSHAQQLIERLESEPPQEFGAGAKS